LTFRLVISIIYYFVVIVIVAIVTILYSWGHQMGHITITQLLAPSQVYQVIRVVAE